MGALGRVFWLGLSALALAGSVALFIVAGLDMRGDEKMFGLYWAAVLAFVFMGTFRTGTRPYRPGAWSIVRGVLLLGLLAVAGFCGIALAEMRLDSEERAMAITGLVFCLVFTLFLGLLPGRFSRPRTVTVEAPGVSAGWGALGSLLVTLAVATVLGSALLTSGAGDPILREVGPFASDVRRFVDTNTHFFVGCALFVPGMFCVLRSRQPAGAAHVLRGGLGFAGAGVLVCVLSRVLPSAMPPDSMGRGIEFSPVTVKALVALFGLGVLSALLLFWPAKAIPAGLG
jgi:hypothetical protein